MKNKTLFKNWGVRMKDNIIVFMFDDEQLVVKKISKDISIPLKGSIATKSNLTANLSIKKSDDMFYMSISPTTRTVLEAIYNGGNDNRWNHYGDILKYEKRKSKYKITIISLKPSDIYQLTSETADV